MRLFRVKYNVVVFFVLFVMVGFAISGFCTPYTEETMAEETENILSDIVSQVNVVEEPEETDEQKLEDIYKQNSNYYKAEEVKKYVFDALNNCIGYTSTITGTLPLSKLGTQRLGAYKQVDNVNKISSVKMYAKKFAIVGYDLSRWYYSEPGLVREKVAKYSNNEFVFSDKYKEYKEDDFISKWGLHPSDMFIKLETDSLEKTISKLAFVPSVDGYTLSFDADTMTMTKDMFTFCFALFGAAKYGVPDIKSKTMSFNIKIDFYGNIQRIDIQTKFSVDLACIGFPGIVVSETLKLSEKFENFNKKLEIKTFD